MSHGITINVQSESKSPRSENILPGAAGDTKQQVAPAVHIGTIYQFFGTLSQENAARIAAAQLPVVPAEESCWKRLCCWRC